jgi:hypothetical protein
MHSHQSTSLCIILMSSAGGCVLLLAVLCELLVEPRDEPYSVPDWDVVTLPV